MQRVSLDFIYKEIDKFYLAQSGQTVWLSVMNGSISGVQAQLRAKIPQVPGS